MNGRYGDIDSVSLTKRGFTLGLALFLFGAVGEIVGHGVLGGIPAWENTLLFELELLGILAGVLSVAVFGVVVPLTR